MACWRTCAAPWREPGGAGAAAGARSDTGAPPRQMTGTDQLIAGTVRSSPLGMPGADVPQSVRDRMNWFEKDVLTTGEVARICNVASRTVSKWFDSGQLRGYRIPGSKDRRIPVSNLIKFMKSHGIPMDGLMSGNTRVLIVDRDDDVVSKLQAILSEQTNFEVRTALSVFAAGIECERFRPHVMLLDIHLGDTDPREVCKMLRTNDDHQVTKIIAMTAKLTDGQAAQLTHQGFDGALRKPFTVRQVIESIESAMAVVY
jgi:excisionase family DNA binding protein